MGELYLQKEQNSYNRTKDVHIIKIDLVCLNKTYNIKEDALLELNIFESIYEHQITGFIAIIDTAGMIENGPITGDEKLIVSFKTSDEGGYATYSKTFNVYKLTERKEISGKKTQTYILNFATPYLDNNQKVRLQRSFKDMREDEIVSIVAKNQLGISKLNVENTKYKYTWVVPAWRPYYLIEQLCKTAVRVDTNCSNFIFYEDRDKHNFVSIDSLIEQAPVFTLSAVLARESKAASHHKYNVASYVINKNFDTLSDSMRGMYGNKITILDFCKKKYEFKDKTYTAHFGETAHFEQAYVRGIPPNETERMFQVASKYNIHKHIDEWGLYRPMDMQQLEHWTWEVQMPGDTGLLVGSVVEFDVATHDHTKDDELDKKLSGKYLVSGIRHVLNYRTHDMTLELQKPNLKS